MSQIWYWVSPIWSDLVWLIISNQYSKVFTKSDDLLHSNFVLDTNLELNSLSKVQFNKQCILSKLTQLNTSKSPGPDGFHRRVLFEIRNELLEPLEILFTASFATGQLPDDWRWLGNSEHNSNLQKR